jgi:EAL domain-containing protein (putative c-di-GMP-specific phosphodiesterase class I)
MNLKVVVEGIETKNQLEVMEAMGVDFIQGYYFSKPIPERDFLEYLNKNNNNLEE